MGNKRDTYVQKLKGNIDKWNGEIDKFQVKADQAKSDAQAQYRTQIEELKAKRIELEEKMAQLQKASEAAWEDVKVGVDKVRKTLYESIESARSRFN